WWSQGIWVGTGHRYDRRGFDWRWIRWRCEVDAAAGKRVAARRALHAGDRSRSLHALGVFLRASERAANVDALGAAARPQSTGRDSWGTRSPDRQGPRSRRYSDVGRYVRVAERTGARTVRV